jgi:sugar lactone lactonase YvrE
MQQLGVGDYTGIVEGIYLEGLSYDFVREVIWYSDVIKGGIYGVRPDGTRVASFDEQRMWTGGVLMNADGAVLSSGAGGIRWNHPESRKSGWLLREIDGKAINGINEMWPDGTGGIYFGTNDIEMIEKAQPTRPSAIYRLTLDRQVVKLADDVNFSNGLAYDTKRQMFYCSDTFNVAWAWNVEADKSLSGRRVLLDKEDCDGMALDVDGNVWITGFRSPGILNRVTPAGELLSPIATPAGSTTQIRFAGADLRDFYINIVPADGGDSLKNGEPLKSPSILYRGRAATAGVAVEPAGFDLG